MIQHVHRRSFNSITQSNFIHNKRLLLMTVFQWSLGGPPGWTAPGGPPGWTARVDPPGSPVVVLCRTKPVQVDSVFLILITSPQTPPPAPTGWGAMLHAP